MNFENILNLFVLPVAVVPKHTGRTVYIFRGPL